MRKLWLVLPALIVLSCAVQKRKYQKGFYVNWHKSASANKEKKKEEPVARAKKETQPPVVSETIAAEAAPLNASADNKVSFTKKQQKNLFQKDDPCDELIFRDGTELKGRVLEISSTEIKYKKCDMPDGPTYVAKKSSVFMIKYANGTREVFKEEAPAFSHSSQNPKKGAYTGPKETHPMAIASLVMGILCFVPYTTIIAAILAIVFGNIALRKIRQDPDRYKGEGLANAGKIIGIVFLSLIALALIIILLILLLLA